MVFNKLYPYIGCMPDDIDIASTKNYSSQTNRDRVCCFRVFFVLLDFFDHAFWSQ